MDIEEEADSKPEINTEEATSTKRVLRPRTKTTQMVRAAQILKEESQPLVIDKDRSDSIL